MSQKNKLEPYQQQIVDEYKEISERTQRLGVFIFGDPIYLEQSEEEKSDIKIQYDAMCICTDALERRISRF